MSRKIETPDTTKSAVPPVTFDVNDPVFQQIVAQAVAARLATIEAEKPAKLSMAGKSEKSLKNEIQTVRAFQKAGFKDIRPHINVLTFNKWIERGYRPVEGSKSLKINNLRLFHVSQCRPITADEKAATKEQQQAAVKRHDKSKVVPIGTGANPQ